MTTCTNKVAVVIPVLNGGSLWCQCALAIHNAGNTINRILVIDSGSTDGSDQVAVKTGFDLVRINKREFDHGGTRQRAAHLLKDYEIIIFLTQDALLTSSHALERLVTAFGDPSVGVAYGRQLPREGASPIEAHARLFNYPAESSKRTLNHAANLGIKAAFTSNSFAAYRTEALFSVGGFPKKLILSEDMVVAARMLQAGWTVAYVADASVYHSHAYTLSQEFRRYFDIGVLHRDQSWILEQFGKPEGEGSRFVRSEFGYLLANAPWQIPSAVIRTGTKYLGYKLGQRSSYLPLTVRRCFSMHRRYWD